MTRDLVFTGFEGDDGSAPPALTAWLAASAILAVRRPRLAALATAPYLVAVSMGGAAISRNCPPEADRRAVPAALVTMQVAWGLGFWEGLLDLARESTRRGGGSS